MRSLGCLFFAGLSALSPLRASAVAPLIELLGDAKVGEEGTHIRAKISAAEGVSRPTAMWRYAGEKSFHSEVMGKGSAPNVFEADLPARPVDSAIEYRIVAFDAKTNDEGQWPSGSTTARVETTQTVSASKGAAIVRNWADGLILELTIKVRRPGEHDWAVLREGESLYDGAEVAFTVETNRKAYVYLAERHKSGSLDQLFPNKLIHIRNPIEGGAPVRIPAQAAYRVDNEDLGTETVVALASPTRLHDIEKAFGEANKGAHGQKSGGHELLAAVSGQGECDSPVRSEASEDDCQPRTRGLILPDADTVPTNERHSVRVAARKKDAMVFVPFQFEHVSKP